MEACLLTQSAARKDLFLYEVLELGHHGLTGVVQASDYYPTTFFHVVISNMTKEFRISPEVIT